MKSGFVFFRIVNTPVNVAPNVWSNICIGDFYNPRSRKI